MSQGHAHLALVGLMGAGKSTIGRACAARLDRPFIDTDAAVEARAGAAVGAIFRDQGEDAFRDLESAVLAEVCALPEPAVIACGGGIVVRSENRALLDGAAVVVWLDAPVAVLSERVGDDSARPLLAGGDTGVALDALLATRRGLYEEVADAVVAAAGPADEVTDAVLDSFHRLEAATCDG